VPAYRAKLPSIHTRIPVVELAVRAGIARVVVVIGPSAACSALPCCIIQIGWYSVAITVNARVQVLGHPLLRANHNRLVYVALLVSHAAVSERGIVHVLCAATVCGSARRAATTTVIGNANARYNHKAAIIQVKGITR